MTTIDKIKGKLDLLADLNMGCENNCAFYLEELQSNVSLQEALDKYYGDIKYWKTGQKYPAKSWGIQLSKIVNDKQQVLYERLDHWFFNQPFSPKFGSSKVEHEHFKNKVIHSIVDSIEEYTDYADMFYVHISPPAKIWYASVWEEFAFSKNNQNWLLGFSVSD